MSMTATRQHNMSSFLVLADMTTTPGGGRKKLYSRAQDYALGSLRAIPALSLASPGSAIVEAFGVHGREPVLCRTVFKPYSALKENACFLQSRMAVRQ